MAKSESIASQNRSQLVALLMAVAVIPRTFQQSLMPRSSLDQGLVTGLTMALVYLMGLLVQDGVNAVAETLTFTEEKGKVSNSASTAAFISLAAIAIGLIAEKKFSYSEDEPLTNSLKRTTGYWVRNVGIAGSIVGAVELVNSITSKNKKKSSERDLLPYMITAGLAYTLAGEYLRVKNEEDRSIKSSLIGAKPLRAVAIGGGVAGLLAGLAYTEKTIAKSVDKIIAKKAPRIRNSWLPIGHAVAAGSMILLLTKFLQSTYAKIEQQAETFEEGFSEIPKSSYVSGSSESNVEWSKLSVQGRRHILSRLSAKDIEAVISKKSSEPIRIFIGLDTAESEEERVELALKELERTKAYEKETIVVISPTGTGYVNYVFSECLEYLSKGNIASVTIQYSKRPSPMSLDRVDEGHIQYRMLLNGISKRIAGMPKNKRPRVVLFGESLGAWTSQDSLMHSGTDGLKALNVERALWIGTPKGSKWKSQVSSKKWLNTDPELIGTFDNYQEVLDLKSEDREKLRYIMVTHYNDPIAQFSLELLIKQPEWVDNDNKRPKGLSKNIKYRTPGLFVQMMIDMKNSLKPTPGDFVASGHDYRGDIAQFTAFAYNYPATPAELEAIEEALKKNEIKRAKLIEQEKAEKTDEE